MTTEFDKQIQQSGLFKWLPWVGEHYSNLEINDRILLIGESHYWKNEQGLDSQKSPGYTRAVVTEMAIDGHKWGRSQFYHRINQLLGGKVNLSREEREKLWGKVAFYNFVQRPMNTNKERPSKTDLINSWLPLIELTEILQPSHCIFLGTSMVTSFESAIKTQKLVRAEYAWGGHINGAYAKTGSFINQNDHKVNLVFIKHPSARFTVELWQDFLNSKIPDQLEYFRKVVDK